jgi:hypothetical protein
MPTIQTSTAATLAPAPALRLVPSAPAFPPFELPDIPRLHHAARRIDSEGEGELRWFPLEPAHRQHRELKRRVRQSARDCQRVRIRKPALPQVRRSASKAQARGKETVVDWRDGTGMAPRDHFGKRVTYAAGLAEFRKRMQKQFSIVLMSKPQPREGIDPENAWAAIAAAFKAQGKRLMTDQAFRAAYDRIPDEYCRPCQPCQGIGVVPRRAR